MTPSSRDLTRTAITALALGLALGSCSGRGSGGATTCDEWRQLSPTIEKQFAAGDPLGSDQEAVAKKLLREHRKDDLDAMNIAQIALRIQSFCGVDGSGHWKNGSAPIEAAANFG